MRDPQKLPPRRLIDDINELVGWYESNRPSAGKVLEIGATPQQLGKALNHPKPIDGKWPYEYDFRGRKLVAIK